MMMMMLMILLFDVCVERIGTNFKHQHRKKQQQPK